MPTCSNRVITRIHSLYTPDFEGDLNRVRQNVADRIYGVETAVHYLGLLEKKPLGHTLTEELAGCLGAIARGECPTYQVQTHELAL